MKLLMIALLSLSSQFMSAAEKPLETVSRVDLDRYVGKWYEIAAFPQSFEKNCTGSTADYSLLPGGKIRVVNTCHLKSLEGKIKVAKGVAYVVDRDTNAKLKVTFFWPFYGDYWILDLDADYEYAMVGAPDREYLWFLSRTPVVSSTTFGHLLEKARDLGFDVSKLKLTLQARE